MAGSDEVNKNLDDFFRRKRAALYALGQHYAEKSEAYAKDPPFPLRPLRKGEKDQAGNVGTWKPHGTGPLKWRTQFGDARRGLFGAVQDTGQAIRVRISHTEQHGVYLELAHQGRYGVLDRTVKKFAPEFIKDAERVIKAGGG